MTNIKTNLVGLGDYINNVNSDLSQLLFSFDTYSKQVKNYITIDTIYWKTFCLVINTNKIQG